MSLQEIIHTRGISEILHFTTNQGLLGVLHTKALRSKANLQNDKTLEFILKPNAPVRKDPLWLGHVNLSITRINGTYFSISSTRWHRGEDIWWCVLAFSPEVLIHKDVVFTTTNNIWPNVKRQAGSAGLEGMFAGRVLGSYNSVTNRTDRHPLSCPTCEQAEVLYPGEISTNFLTRIYVRTDEEADQVSAQLAVTSHPDVEVVVSKQIFEQKSW